MQFLDKIYKHGKSTRCQEGGEKGTPKNTAGKEGGKTRKERGKKERGINALACRNAKGTLRFQARVQSAGISIG